MKFNFATYWYQSKLHPLSLMLCPFSWIFGVGVAARRWSYQKGWRAIKHFPVPIIVVGNITVGGTGKTPFVIWLARLLKTAGYHPGIVSRGMGGKKHHLPYQVEENDLPAVVGDEAKLILQHTQCPVVIGINRAAAVNHLLRHSNCNIVISDDGLQHYQLGRHLEIAMMDGQRQFGNGCLLPAGPLREKLTRLNHVDFVIIKEGNKNLENNMTLEPGKLISLSNSTSFSLTSFPQKVVHAVAGIGHPEQFFNLLRSYGYKIIPHTFKDHYSFEPKDLDFNDNFPIIMTEKDAIKCTAFHNARCWYLSVFVKIKKELEEKLLSQIKVLTRNHEKDISKYTDSILTHSHSNKLF